MTAGERYRQLGMYIAKLQSEQDEIVNTHPCEDFSPAWFTGHWRDWHRGHGCYLDDGRPRPSPIHRKDPSP